MIFTTAETLSYYTTLVRTQRRDWFLAAMFLPPIIRDSVIAIYSLDIELEHVHHVVNEEMMGHIRYAWWFENLESLPNSSPAQANPVLQALSDAKIPVEILLAIATPYRESFPELPAKIDEIVQNTVRSYLDGSLKNKKWKKASSKIASHRKKYGLYRDSWLLFKLLFV